MKKFEAFSNNDIKVVKKNVNKWNVDIIVLVKEEKKEDIQWFFRAHSPEFGMLFSSSGLKVEVDKNIFSNNLYFTKLYEDEYYVVLRNKTLKY